MKFFVLLIFFFCLCIAKAQTRFNINSPIGTDTLLDIGVKVIELTNKQILSCGTSSHPFVNYKSGYLVKMDNLGNLIWKKQYDIGAGYNDFFQDLVELPDSNYLICGITGNPSLNLDEAFLAKIDTSGNIIWLKKYPYTNSNEQPRSMKLTPDGKVIIVGSTFTTGNRDGLLIKTDLNGNLIWRKTFTNTVAYDEVYYSIDVIKNNNEYIISGMKGYYNSGNSYFDLSLLRTDTAGIVLWQQEYGTTADETGNGGITTLDSGYVLCGVYNGEGAIIKVDKQGIWNWFKNYNLSSSSVISQVIQLPDSGFALITSSNDFMNTNTTGFLVRTDKDGNMLWKRIYPHPQTTPNLANYFFGFNTTADKGFIITGQYNHIGQPYQNMWLVKTDSLGCDSMGGCIYIPTNIVSSSVVENSFEVYPNPSTEIINVRLEMLNDRKDLKIKITDVLGREVLVCPLPTDEDTEGGFSINISSLQNGIYFLNIYKYGKVLSIQKIIKQ